MQPSDVWECRAAVNSFSEKAKGQYEEAKDKLRCMFKYIITMLVL